MQDLWVYKDKPNPSYPTQKNSEMISQIIKNSSDNGSIVLDCFMGSGTTLMEAYKLNRNWIGIDNSPYAIEVFEKNYNGLNTNLFNNKHYEYIKL